MSFFIVLIIYYINFYFIIVYDTYFMKNLLET